MRNLKKTAAAALAVLALGGASIASFTAEASPRHSSRHGGWHHGGHWGYGGGWSYGGHWGRPIGWAGGAASCQVVIRYDAYGYPIGRRRICYPGY